jgi:colicin import membrane protein
VRKWILISSAAWVTSGALAQDTASPSASPVEQENMRSVIVSCLRTTWRHPGGQAMRVTLRWRLERDGSLSAPPELVGPAATPQVQPSADAATTAVTSCAPFALPPEHYDTWKVITWDFIP